MRVLINSYVADCVLEFDGVLEFSSGSKPTALASPDVWLFMPAMPLLMHQQCPVTVGVSAMCMASRCAARRRCSHSAADASGPAT